MIYVALAITQLLFCGFGVWIGFDAGYDDGWWDHSQGLERHTRWPWRRGRR